MQKKRKRKDVQKLWRKKYIQRVIYIELFKNG